MRHCLHTNSSAMALLPPGSADVPPFDGSRLLAAAWLMASLVFMSSYSGILTAMLTVPRVTIPIDSLADLVAQDELPWRLEAGSFMFQYFRVKGLKGSSWKKKKNIIGQ